MTSQERQQKMLNTGLRIGKHFGPGGKFALSTLEQAIDAPASAMQLFAGNPQRYWGSKVPDEDICHAGERGKHPQDRLGYFV